VYAKTTSTAADQAAVEPYPARRFEWFPDRTRRAIYPLRNAVANVLREHLIDQL